MAESALTLLSMAEQAMVRYLIAGHAGSVDDTYGSVRSLKKNLPETVVWAEQAAEEQLWTGNYEIALHIMVKSSLAEDQETEGDDDLANAHEARSAAVYNLLKIDAINSNGMPLLSAALSAQNIPNFSVGEIMEAQTGYAREFEGDCVVDTYSLRVFASPSLNR